jgi:hypothetical protein
VSTWSAGFSAALIVDGRRSRNPKHSIPAAITVRFAFYKDKRWTLYRNEDIGDEGNLLGTYQGRRDATRALEKIAYAPEPH